VAVGRGADGCVVDKRLEEGVTQFKIGDFVQYRNADSDSYFNRPSKVLAVLPSGLIKRGTEACFFNSSPKDLILTASNQRLEEFGGERDGCL
jgi:hypothetical protein